MWAIVLVAHWYVGESHPMPQRLRLYRLFGSAVGLFVGTIGLGNLVAFVLRRVYDSVSGGLLVNDYSWSWGDAVGWLIIGGAVWAWYWLANSLRRDADGALWSGYVLILGVFAGIVTAVSALAIVLFDTLRWVFGDATSDAVDHFSSVPGAVAALITGAWVWWYHRTVLAPVRIPGRGQAHRAYDYLLAAVGLVTTTTAVAVLIVAFFESFGSAPIARSDGGLEVVLAAVTGLIVGVPLWMSAWRPNQRLVATEPSEMSSSIRRAYLFLVFGVGGVAALISLVVIFVSVFDALLDGSGNILREVDWPVAIVLAVGANAVYHWRVYRSERSSYTQESRLRDVLLIGADDELARQVRETTGAKVQAIRRSDETLLTVEAVADALRENEEESVLVVSIDGGTRVVGLRR